MNAVRPDPLSGAYLRISDTRDLLFPGAELPFEAKAVGIFAIPYFCGAAPGNLSLYARGRDYHTVVREIIGREAAALGGKSACFADVSPFDEVRLALRAGLGVLGDNGLLITPEFGSWVFLGELITDAEVACAEPREPRGCLHCGACARACPGGAISSSRHGYIDSALCASAISQKKGTLTDAETAILRRSGMVWGCDACQLSCPMNRGVRETSVPDFRNNLVPSIGCADVDGLSNRAFREKFPDRAFTWRGAEVVRRNAGIK